mgnify:CR=1 FL=1
MTIVKHSKRYLKARSGTYEIEVQDYGYRNRPPVAVRVSGTVDGECRNSFSEPCYFYQSAEAMSLSEGMRKAQAIVAERGYRVPLG